ncbi:fibrous sheath CABYR-binding protein isoform X2 [Amphiprion ocellaris]|uniref:fibrous sheath CABYR-binding protein isoform X2 n=1 Tax=Amphiprion ocellaris TaxID=80972 RepID=UPI00241166E5|nr:fibrous sheath CABYR-binding protein isoform X2 [Amphiprion ocellaris]
MSKDVDRNQVFKTTRVRTALKNDGSWIHKSKEDEEEQDKEGMFHTMEAKRVPVRQSSYVLLTARKFGNSAPEANGDVIPAEKGAQPEGSTVETTGDTKSQAVTQNGKTEQEKSAADTTTENKEECVKALGDKSKVEPTEAAAEVSAAVHVEENIQPVSSAQENPEAESPADQPFINTTAENKEEQADPSSTDRSEAVSSADANVEIPAAEISAVDDTAESKSTAEVPAALIPEVKPQEESLIKTEPATATNLVVAEAEINVQPIEGSSEKSPPEQTTGEIVAAAANVMVESSYETTDVTNATPGEVSVESLPDLLLESLTKSPTQPAAETPTEASFEISPPAQFTDEAVEAAAEVVVEEIPENPCVNNATQLEEAAVQNSVQAHSDVLSEPPAQPAAETTTEDNREKCPSDQSAQDIVEAVAKVVIESLPESPAVNNATPEEEAALQSSVQPVHETQSDSPTYLPTKTITEESGEKCPPEQNTKEIYEVVAEVVVETLPENVVEPVNNATPEEEAALQSDLQPVIDTQSESPTHPSTETAPEGSVEEAARQVQQVSDVLSEPPTQPAAETTTETNCEKCPADQGVQETIRAAAEVVVETLPESPAAHNATPGEEAAAQPVLESPPQPAAETVVKSVEGEVEPAAVEESVLKTTAEEVVERVVNTVVEQSVESAPDSAADRVSELNIEDAVKPETAPDAGAAQEDLAATVIKLTDALDVEPPTAETVPEPVEDSEQSHSDEPKVNQQCDDTNISEVFQKTAQEPNSTQTLTKSGDEKATCCFCHEIIDGREKISFSEPLLTCHPECLKCSVCAKALGDMLTPMYLHQKEIQCGDCFVKTLKI